MITPRLCGFAAAVVGVVFDPDCEPEVWTPPVVAPTASTLRPGSKNALVLTGLLAFDVRSVTSTVAITFTRSPGLRNPPTACVSSRLIEIACALFLPTLSSSVLSVPPARNASGPPVTLTVPLERKGTSMSVVPEPILL